MGKITCKYKDDIKTSISAYEMVAIKPNACYVNQELTCLPVTSVLVIFKRQAQESF
jgi:hypothetical protein